MVTFRDCKWWDGMESGRCVAMVVTEPESSHCIGECFMLVAQVVLADHVLASIKIFIVCLSALRLVL